ncbi:MAG: hypothetical protein QM784_19510 [Polyangiaceae bacterium]
MFPKSGPWIYVASGAAIGLVAWGAHTRRQRLSRARNDAPLPSTNDTNARVARRAETHSSPPQVTSRRQEATRTTRHGDADLSQPMKESLSASTHAHLARKVRDEFAQDFAARAERKGSHQKDEERHEVSSLASPIALAPDTEEAGRPLRDPEVFEVPFGQSADPDIDALLLDDEAVEAESTGSALRTNLATSGVHEAITPRQKRIDDEAALTARPSDDNVPNDDAYDAVAPDDLGSEWLNRATEAATVESRQSSREAIPSRALAGVGDDRRQ